MKISTKGRYALRFMADLARAGEGVRLSVKEVSQRQGISDKYLEQIAHLLAGEGFITSTRGAQGGYQLARPASEITVGQVLRACEGDLSPVECVGDGGKVCERADNCDTFFVWMALKQATDNVVDGITIQDLVTRGE